MTVMLCPCKSGKAYKACCKGFHEGKLPKTALELMRSRFSAYALRLPDYIIETTHSDNPGRIADQKLWRKEVLKFSEQTRFDGLKIESFEPGEESSFVCFTAQLRQGSRDASFTEKSLFEKVNGKWLYKSGVTQGTVK